TEGLELAVADRVGRSAVAKRIGVPGEVEELHSPAALDAPVGPAAVVAPDQPEHVRPPHLRWPLPVDPVRHAAHPTLPGGPAFGSRHSTCTVGGSDRSCSSRSCVISAMAPTSSTA